MRIKLLLGIFSSILTILCYLPYIRDILKQKTHPHAFSWLTWSILAGISFAIQMHGNGGAGSWTWAISTTETLFIFFLSLRYGKQAIKRMDWLCLGSAGIGLILWFVTNRPILSIIFISLVSSLGGFLPTFRKSYNNPEQETAITYILGAINLVLSLFALETFTITNALYPFIAFLLNGSLALFLIVRRKKIKIKVKEELLPGTLAFQPSSEIPTELD